MKLKDRIKTYNFWVSLASALFLIINVIGRKFNFYVDEGIFNDIFTAICGILVLLGIIVPPKTKDANASVKLLNENELLNDTAQFLDTDVSSDESQTAAISLPSNEENIVSNPDAETKPAQDQETTTPNEPEMKDIQEAESAQPESFYEENCSKTNEDLVEMQQSVECNEDLTAMENRETEEDSTASQDFVCTTSVVEDKKPDVNSTGTNNLAFVNLLRKEEEKFSGSKEALKQILYGEIERLDN